MMDNSEAAHGDLERVAALVAQMFVNLESRRKFTRSVREQVPALESTWSSIERNVLTLGRRRRSIEAPLEPLPEPRGAAATQNWLEQRGAQGARTGAWVERLPAALALLRSVGPVEAFGASHPLPTPDDQRAEALRSQMRQAIVRQDIAAMDSTLRQIQASLTADGQRRTDLMRIVDSRVGDLVPTLIALAGRDATAAPEMQRWQRDVCAHTSALLGAFSRWDVGAAREAETKLNALVDELPGLRGRLEREVQTVAAAVAAKEQEMRELTARRSGLMTGPDDGVSFGRSVAAGGAAFGGVGALTGLVAAAVIVALQLSAPWNGVLALSVPVLLTAGGIGVGAVVGAGRLRRQLSEGQTQASLVDRKIADYTDTIAETRRRLESLCRILDWYRI